MRPLTEKNYKELSAGLEQGKSVDEVMGTLTPGPKKKARKSQQREEWKIQSAVNKWWLSSCAGFGFDPCLYYSVPNGFISQGKEEWQKKGSLIKAWLLKLAGLKSGIPDNVLAVMRGGYGALYIEYKAPDGVVSDEQKHVHTKLLEQNYRVEVCWNVQDAVNIITNYILS